MVYRGLECAAEFAITEILYTCPHCRGLFLLEALVGNGIGIRSF